MKILYIDLLSPKGHKNFNYSLLNILNDISYTRIDLAFKKNYLKDFKYKKDYEKIFEIPNKFFSEKFKSKFLNKIFNRIKFFNELKWLRNNIDIENYDLVFFSSIETITFSLMSSYIDTRVVFVDHSIGEIYNSFIKRIFWKQINSKFEIIVMEDYIRSYILQDMKINNKIWMLPHPLPNIDKKFTNKNYKSEDIIFAPGNSNDEEFISFLLESDLSNYKYKIIIKSNKYNYNSKKLSVYNNRISFDDYYKIMSRCKYILLPYKRDYNFRVSGVFFEAIFFNKPVIINTNNTLKYYKNEFSNLVTTFNNHQEFLKTLENIKYNEKQKYDLEKAKYKHSDKNIKEKLKKILKDGSALID